MTIQIDSRSETRSKWIWGLTALALGVILWRHAAVLAPFFLSLVMAYGLRPAVDAMVRKGVPRVVAVFICLLVLTAMVCTVLVLLVPIISQLAPKLKTQLPDLAASVWHSVAPYFAQWGIELPSDAEAIKAELVRLIQAYFPQLGQALLQSVLIGGSGLLTVAGYLLLVPVLAFYCLLDWDALSAKWRSLVPPRWRPAIYTVLNECDGVMGQYLRGQLLVMGIMAAFYSIGLGLFGFHLALPIGVFTGLAMFVPYLGYTLGLILALLAGMLQFADQSQGLVYPLIAVTVVYGFGQFLESFLLTPRLVGERIGLHPVGVILALVLFGQWAGLVGVLIALPVSAVLMVLGRYLLAVYRASNMYQDPPAPPESMMVAADAVADQHD